MQNTNTLNVTGSATLIAAKNEAQRALHFTGRERMLLASDVLPPCDCIAMLIAAFVSSLLYSFATSSASFASLHWVANAWSDRGNVALIGATIAPFILYDQSFALRATQRRIATLIRSFALRFALTMTLVLLIARGTRVLDDVPAVWMCQWIALSLVFTALLRYISLQRVLHMQKRGALTESVAVVGAGPIADGLDRHLRLGRAPNIELVGVFDDTQEEAEADVGKVRRVRRPVHSIERLIEISKTRNIDWILIAAPPGDEQKLTALIERLQVLSVRIALCPESIGLRLPHGSVDYAGNGMPIVLLADRPIKRWDSIIKSIEDIVLGGIITTLLLPLFLIIAIAIRLDSPGPVIFKQRRHAFSNREFFIYKFRTMRWQTSAEPELKQTQRGDERITRVGRFLRETSLDELPQLFNVLRGEMSLVGPRPHAVNMRTEDRLGWEITDRYAHRHRVKPGMTGWSQVNGARGATHTMAQLQRRIELDLYYIDNWSLALDFKILLMTFQVVWKRTNAF